MTERLLILGGGQAGAQIIESARARGFSGAITLASEEHLLPYCRPPLSKSYLVGDQGADWLLYREPAFYERHKVEMRLGLRAARIERASGRVVFETGETIAYDKLALAIGARVRRLPEDVRNGAEIHYIRTQADVARIRAALPAARRVLIIGGGFIGLEAAAALATTGRAVTVLVTQERVLTRAVAPVVSDFFARAHGAHGVNIVLGAQVRRLEQSAAAVRVFCADGEAHEGDLVVAGIGIAPNVELAQDAGLACDNGIVVDVNARTSDPAIFAAGDCTAHPNAQTGGLIRRETVHNAVEQARTAGASIAGESLPYVQTPWVWSDQFRYRLQSVGVTEGHDRIVLRGDPARERFSAHYFKGEVYLGMNSVNRPAEFGACRRILNQGLSISPDEAADPAFDFDARAPRRTRIDFDDPWPTRAEKAARKLTPLPAA